MDIPLVQGDRNSCVSSCSTHGDIGNALAERCGTPSGVRSANSGRCNGFIGADSSGSGLRRTLAGCGDGSSDGRNRHPGLDSVLTGRCSDRSVDQSDPPG